MNETSIDKRSQASARLALAITRESAAFSPPSDEELAAMLEAGLAAESVPGIDTTRRAQIVDAIANDPASFNRWSALIEAAETLELAGFGREASIESSQQSKAGAEKSSWIKSLFGSLFSSPFKGFATAGGGLAAASVLTLMVTTSVNQQSQLDQLYGNYGSQWAAMPAGQSATRSVSSAVKLELSAEDSALYAGVSTGIDKLGQGFSLPNLADASAASSIESLDSDLSNSLYIAGQIAAISYFKCSLGANPAYYTEALLLLEDLQPVFANATDTTSSALNKTLNRRGDDETTVCRFSKQIVSRVSY